MNPLLLTFIFLGLAFVVAMLEIFLPATMGLLAVLAFVLLVTSIVYAFQVNMIFGSLYTFFVCMLIPIFLWLALRTWPKTWIGKQILLDTEDDPALVPDENQCVLQQLIGKHGMARSKMLLGGLIEIEGCQYSAVSDAEPVEKGDPICVVRIEGTSIIVRKLSLQGSAMVVTEDIPLEDPFAESEKV